MKLEEWSANEREGIRTSLLEHRARILHSFSMLTGYPGPRFDEKVDSVVEYESEDLQEPDPDPCGNLYSGFDQIDSLAETGSDVFEQELKYDLVEIESDQLELIGAAMRRLRYRSFGICADCRRPVSRARLRAIPYAEVCIRCQWERETESTGSVTP